jgi:hypothetical protein
MIGRDDFDGRLLAFMDEASGGSAPTALLQTVLATTERRRQRSALVVAIRGGGIGQPRSRRGGRRLVAIVVAAVVLALIAGLVLIGIGQRRAGPAGVIEFYRTDASRSTNTAFTLGKDGSEALLPRGIGLPSPDGRQLLTATDDTWVRPAVSNADGSGYRVLDAFPGRAMHLAPVAWSPDASRILVASGPDAPDPADVGLFTVRATDGGDLRLVEATPPGDGDAVIGYSPDGSQILLSRIGPNPAIWIVAADGSSSVLLSPASWTPVDLAFWDDAAADFSRDGSQVVYAAITDEERHTVLAIVNADGSHRRTIVGPQPGAVSARWSPAADVIAFTSGGQSDTATPAGNALVGSPQVWVVHSDGTGLRQLTTGSDGSTSVTPVWSPDGTKLLFQRKLDREVTLWTMNADGSEARQLVATPLAEDYVGAYVWKP